MSDENKKLNITKEEKAAARNATAQKKAEEKAAARKEKVEAKSEKKAEKLATKLAKAEVKEEIRTQKTQQNELAKTQKAEISTKKAETKAEKKAEKANIKAENKEGKAVQKTEIKARKAEIKAEKAEIAAELSDGKKVYDWYKLDNAGKIFPAVSSVKDTNVFRVGVRLKHDIDPEILHAALLQTLKRFPAFRVKLRKGGFWFFFEFNEKKPIITQDDDCPCALIVPAKLNDYLFKTSYFQNRIYLDVFHSLSDGGGATEFLKTLVFCYLKMAGEEVETEGLVKNPFAKSSITESENSYIKYYDKHNKKVTMPPAAHQMKGSEFEYGFSVINAHTDAAKFLQLAKAKGATITQYVVTVLLLSIYKIDFLGNPHNWDKPIQVLVPVNLRKIFPSETLRNFSSFVHGGIKNGDALDFDSVLESVKKSFSESLDPKFMLGRFSSHTQIEKNPIIRCVPLGLKNLIMRIVYYSSGIKNITTNFSNLGVVKFPKSMEKHIDGLEFQSSVSPHGVTFASAVTYQKKMTISFTRRIKECRLEKEFFRYLKSEGLEFEIESTYFEE